MKFFKFLIILMFACGFSSIFKMVFISSPSFQIVDRKFKSPSDTFFRQ